MDDGIGIGVVAAAAAAVRLVDVMSPAQVDELRVNE